MKSSILIIVAMLMMQGCSQKSVQKNPTTQDVLIKQLYNKIYALEKKVENISAEVTKDDITRINNEIVYHEEILTALIKDVGALKDSNHIVSSQKLVIKDEPLNSSEDHFEPLTFKLTKDSEIINSNNEVLSVWSRGKSFTSYIKRGEYYKVTGYFTSKKWKKADKDLWIAIDSVVQR